ncbi:hypothetical protein FA15DRAFT_666888 [Coprinopsis marcescibilis]|uniref:Uncharacterized protein n=1 Tax=Coprinopsis marcescibilis TaxID=230819 RepID=A0A5C3L2K3_COPMA|nr:hypothetical protein FA15DRAFT_666888 [Coprinopsis marcescibilis]
MSSSPTTYKAAVPAKNGVVNTGTVAADGQVAKQINNNALHLHQHYYNSPPFSPSSSTPASAGDTSNQGPEDPASKPDLRQLAATGDPAVAQELDDALKNAIKSFKANALVRLSPSNRPVTKRS